MSKEKENSQRPQKTFKKDKDDNQRGYPLYPEGEDIYEKFDKKSNVDPADISKDKTSIGTNTERQKALDKKHTLSGKDLDVPGSELDDAQEATGNEDEENNYYSLGGDDHDDLEEDKGT